MKNIKKNYSSLGVQGRLYWKSDKLKSERWKAVSHVERDGWTIQADREEYANVGGSVIMGMRGIQWITPR